MSQMPTIQDLTNKQTCVKYNGFSCTCVALAELRVHHVASDAETWQLQYCVFGTLHLLLKRGNYSTACSLRCF
jgi:hypothetical protein